VLPRLAGLIVTAGTRDCLVNPMLSEGFTGVAVAADVTAFADMPAHDFRHEYLHTCMTVCAVVINIAICSKLRLTVSNQERSNCQVALEQSTRLVPEASPDA